MPEKNDYADIKAGVDGGIGDVPSPTDTIGEAPGAAEDLPETQTISEDAGGFNQPEQTQSTNYGTPQRQEYQGSTAIDSERMQEIVEAIVKEKWDELTSSVGNLATWKEKMTNDVISVKQEVIRINERFENLQNAILGRVREYDEGMRGVHTEMKALEKVFEKIVEPLSTNIKELGRLVQDMKKATKK